MQIGFIGNTNNYPFMLARALRKLGHEVRFVVFSDDPLNRPECRYPDIPVPYPNWIVDLGTIRLRDMMYPWSTARRKLLAAMDGCDAVIANEFGPMLIPDLGVPAIALLTGSDLYALADADTFLAGAEKFRRLPAPVRKIVKWLLNTRLVSKQRAGIRASAGIAYFPRGILSNSDRILDELKIDDARRVFSLMAEIDAFEYCPPPSNERFRVFCGSRLNWASLRPKGGVEIDYKGAEIMVKGLALFIRNSGVPLDIRLVRKGIHVKETEALIREEGLDPFVTWRDEMTQTEVQEEYKKADVVFDQLGGGLVGMVCLDAMALGRPVIANARPEILKPLLGTANPICQASTAEEVCRQIEALRGNPEDRRRIGVESRRFVEAHLSSIALANRCLKNLFPDFRTAQAK